MNFGSVTRITAGAFLALAMTGVAWAKVDINHATEQQLQALHGIGPAKAHAIVVERRAHGPYQKLSDLSTRVPGIGASTVTGLATDVSFGPSAAPSTTAAPKAATTHVTAPAPSPTVAQKTAAHAAPMPAPVAHVAPTPAPHASAAPKAPITKKTPTHS